ncbi:helix-turn-helix domain-containing protein [Sphingomonas sp. ID1715]|uniref:helix-turn-helix domain-containing protein n=1 Tax=Sphingomonas sp. ID1715 TaxID=1656898 RepID=UPI0020C1D8EB|nr:helix-turn-helix domain-containing protein [Sphingomonas sp. ID1715]
MDQFLDEDGIREEVTAAALKRVIAFALREAMQAERLTKATMAERMSTSRKQLDRVLDPNEHNVTLETLARAAHSVGKTLKVELV